MMPFLLLPPRFNSRTPVWHMKVMLVLYLLLLVEMLSFMPPVISGDVCWYDHHLPIVCRTRLTNALWCVDEPDPYWKNVYCEKWRDAK